MTGRNRKRSASNGAGGGATPRRIGRGSAPLALLALAGCLARTSEVPPAPPPPPPPPVPAAVVWTAAPNVPLVGAAGDTTAIPGTSTRLEVLGRDSLGLLVHCRPCAGEPHGHVPIDSVVHEALPPEVAAWGTLAEFALAVRDAAARRDLDALRPVMSEEFSYSFVGAQTPDAAFAVWRAEGFTSLDRVPDLLDRGLAPLDGRIQAAPPEFIDQPGYRDLRIGFRQRTDGRWEWTFLIGGIVR